MMCRVGEEPGPSDERASTDAAFTALLEDSAEDLYEQAPCGYLSTLMDGTIAKVNATLLGWLGLERADVVGRMRFTDLLTVGGKLYHETHYAPLLRLQGEVHGIALEMKAKDAGRLPTLVSSAVKHGDDGQALLIRTTVFDASDRRAYEAELLRRSREAEQARAEAERAHAQAEAALRQAQTDRLRLTEALGVLQKSLVPSTLPAVPGMEAAVYYHTSSPDRLGGDFYDLFPVSAARWAFFLGNVCGKGPEAASLTSLARYTLRADGRSEFLPTPGGLLVGILPEAHFTTTTALLAPGDTLLLYTDGLTEARTGPTRESLFGDEALLAFATDQAPTTPQGLIEALTVLLKGFGDGLEDDTALLALGVNAAHPTTDAP
ncbi:PP2C family protein-serine/threonine phosphatase [Kitasatospora cineracea]|uniref:PP2C family protein-serine/threonine phosphatase n=1 Tax=Kitasatospora cineracea TaxID=88074 RepID=UPI0036D7D2AF